MGIRYESLDDAVRNCMVQELERDISNGSLYISPRLTHAGVEAWPAILREAFTAHDDTWIASALRSRGLLRTHEQRRKPIRIAHFEEFSSREDAVAREKELKTGFGRKWLKKLIASGRARQAGQPFGMDAETAALFPASFQDSPLGKIPKGWKASRLGEIAENVRRGVDPEAVPDETPYIGLEHMPRKSIALANWGHAGEVASNKFEFRQGEILFGKLRPYFHKVGVAVQDGVCSTDILVIGAKSQEWYGLALGHASSEEFVNYTDAVSIGTKMPRTNWQDMSRYEIPLPDSRLADAFSRFARVIVDKIRQNILQSITLAAIRDALLPKLISGDIRVKDAERPVTEVRQ